jgi:hypothetical protein
LANDAKIEFLGRIPIDPLMFNDIDNLSHNFEKSHLFPAFDDICKRINVKCLTSDDK